MDCNLEALATLMLFHIKVSLFYPFDSQRLDFVKIILSDLEEKYNLLPTFLQNSYKATYTENNDRSSTNK
jgi:hypothetical protein